MLNHASFVVLNFFHPILGERRVNQINFKAMNQMNHQECGTSKLRQFTSNPPPLLPRQFLWFHISWGDSIIMQLIMMMSSFTLQIIPWNIPLTLFQTQMTLLLNPLMIMKWTKYTNYFTCSMMMIF